MVNWVGVPAKREQSWVKGNNGFQLYVFLADRPKLWWLNERKKKKIAWYLYWIPSLVPHVFLCIRTGIYLLHSNATYLQSEIILKETEHVFVVSATNYFLSIIQISTWRLGLKKLFSISHCQSMDIWEPQKWCLFHLWLATIPPNNWYSLLNFCSIQLKVLCVYMPMRLYMHTYLLNR